jgi:hypothetical protein
LLHGILDRQLHQLGMDGVADLPHRFPLDRVGLAADPRCEFPASAVVERGHLGEPRGLAVEDPVAEARLQVTGELFEHP